MIKKSICSSVFCLVCLFAVFAEELAYAGVRINGLDIELSQVNLIAEAFEGERIAYRFELAEGKKLSCVETQRTLRIRQMNPSKGTLYLFIPKTLLLENCSMRINRADISVSGIRAVHLLTMMNRGAAVCKECTLKNAVINIARGRLSFDKTEVVRSCAFTVTDAIADIMLPSEESEYHLDYVHNGGSLTVAGKEYTKSPGEYGNIKAKRRIIFSGGAATASIRFTEKNTK